MKKINLSFIPVIILAFGISSDLYGQANTQLSNLVANTAVNQHLLPSVNNNKNLGSAGKSWKDLYLDGDVAIDNIIFITNRNIGSCTFLGGLAGNATVAANTTGVRYQSLYSNSIGSDNTAIGIQSLFMNSFGSYNTAVGRFAMYSNTSGNYNTAAGVNAMFSNTTGSSNTATGYQSLHYNTSGLNNTALGLQALFSNTTASNNIAVGQKTMFSNITGEKNTAIGTESFYSNTFGSHNTATGYRSLYANAVGSDNTANGYEALYSNYDGYYNSAFGYQALYSNGSGSRNTATGYQALYSNTSGELNTANGYQALYNNTIGEENTATGYWALTSNTDGIGNAANGIYSLYANTTGYYNAAFGSWTMTSNTTGTFNTAVGTSALQFNNVGTSNTAVGTWAMYLNTFGSYNTALGYAAAYSGASFSNATSIGYNAQATASNQVYLGDASVTGVYCFSGLYTSSDNRFKTEIEENVPGLAFITKLRPVTYHYDMDNIAKFLNTPDSLRLQDSEILKSKIVYTGFIAQEVEKSANEIGYNFSGVSKPKNESDYYAIDYAEFVVPLVQAAKELNTANTDQNILIANQQIEIDELKSQIATLIALSNNPTTNDGFAVINNNTSNSALLGQNVPNPFDNSTLIPFRIPKHCMNASIIITNTGEGKVISVVPISCDETHIVFEAGQLPNGSYSYTLIVDGFSIGTKTMVLTN